MGRRHRNGRAVIHGGGKLVQSHPTVKTVCGGPTCEHNFCAVKAGFEVNQRVLSVVALYERVTGNTYIFEDALHRDIKRLSPMLERHKNCDYRHTEDEMKALKSIAQWSLELNAKLRNQEKPEVEF